MSLLNDEKTILSLIAVGRDSLDHFVDTLQIDCQEARGLANGLIISSHIKQRGYFFMDMLSYDLTKLGAKTAENILGMRSEGAKKLNILDDQYQVMLALKEGKKSKVQLEKETPEMLGGAIQSVLSDLEEKGLIEISGFFQVYAQLTRHGESSMALVN